MKKATRVFTKDEINRIQDAVGAVEKTTSAEVVPVVATASGRYDRAEDLFGFLLSLLVLGFTWAWFQEVAPAAETWGAAPTLRLTLPLMLALLAVTFFIGMALASWFPVLRLPLVTRQEMKEEVERSARETFQRLRVRKTADATGILIYVSLYEHMVHVVGDDTIAAQFLQEDWKSVSDLIVGGFKDGNPEKGMRNGILHCGEILARHFPVKPGDKNELSNTLHLID